MDEAGLFGMQQCECWRAMKKLVCVGLVLASAVATVAYVFDSDCDKDDDGDKDGDKDGGGR